MIDHVRRASGDSTNLTIFVGVLSLVAMWQALALRSKCRRNSRCCPAALQPIYGAGITGFAAGKYLAAEHAFREALVLDPIRPDSENRQSGARQQRETEAISLYEKALHLEPGDLVTRRNLGVAYFRARQYQAALPLLENSAKQTPSFQVLEFAGLENCA